MTFYPYAPVGPTLDMGFWNDWRHDMGYYFRDGEGCPWIQCGASVVADIAEAGFETALMVDPLPAPAPRRGAEWRPLVAVAKIVHKALHGQTKPEKALRDVAALFSPPEAQGRVCGVKQKQGVQRSGR